MVRDLKRARTKDSTGKWMRLRVLVVAGVFLTLLFAVFGRAVQLQVQQESQLKTMAQDQYVRQIETPARRGDVLDRRGVPLAQSVDVDSVWLDPSMVADQKLAAHALAKALELDEKDLLNRFVKGKRFAWVKRQVTPQELAKAKALNLPGLGTTKEPRRFYPQRELAAQTVGFVGTDGHGMYGLEQSFEDELSGDPLTQAGLRDAKGRTLNTTGVEDVSAHMGATVTLTLDRQIQYLTEKALNKAVEDSKAIGGMGVVLDPKTGEILALASAPRFNPNAVAGLPKDSFKNHAASDVFEPGSTFKSFVVASALDEKLVTETTPVDTGPGWFKIGRNTINDTHPHGLIDVKRVLQYSSNIGAAKIGAQLGRDKLQHCFQQFGFGERTQLGLPGEGKGSVPFPKAEITLATQSFGQGVSATAVQVAAAYGALANGGMLMRPYLVSKVVDPDGVKLLEHEPTQVRQAVTAKSAQRVLAMLESVVEKEGTAPKARMDEYRMAGKTGTAQKPDPNARGYSNERITSFVGIVPAEAPRLVIYIAIDEPKTDLFGGLSAAPAVKEIAAGALAYLSVPPSRPSSLTPVASNNAPPAVPDTAAVTADKAASGSKKAAGSHANSNVPAALSAAFERALDPNPQPDEAAPGTGSIRVPDLRGSSGRDAVTSLLAVALQPRLEGSGWVASQRPAAGSLVEKGSRVTVELAGILPNSPH